MRSGRHVRNHQCHQAWARDRSAAALTETAPMPGDGDVLHARVIPGRSDHGLAGRRRGMSSVLPVEGGVVERGVNVPQSYRLVRRDAKPERTVVRLPNGAAFGGDEIAICAGPCGVESREQLETAAKAVAEAGANVLRGGAYKPRTSPYSFQGLGEEGLKLLRDAADRNNLAVVTEVLDPRDVDRVASYVIMPTCCRSVLVTCRTSCCCERSARCARRCCSSADYRRQCKEWLLAAEYGAAGRQTKTSCCANAAFVRSMSRRWHGARYRGGATARKR